MPSARGRDALASPIRRLTPFADAAKGRGVSVLHLNIGQPDIPTPTAVIDAYRAFAEPVLAYGPSEGTLAYRTALAAYYNDLGYESGGRAIEANDVIVTTGGSEALLFGIAATCDPGDEILVAEPYYPNYRGFSHILAVGTRAVTTTAQGGYRVSAAQVAEAIGARTKALVLSSPGNPTGTVLSSQELRDIATVCRDRGVFFLSDEVYRDFVYDAAICEGGSTAPGLLAQPGFDDNALLIDSVSKRYSACGARIGCLVTRNRALRAAVLKFAQTRLSPPVVDQLAAHAALATPSAVLRSAIDDYRRRRDALVAGLRAIPGVQVRSPDGAFYLFATLPVDDAEKFCIWLLDHFEVDGETVMMAPADGFYATPGLGKDEVRIAYVLQVAKLVRACAILGRALQSYPGRRPAA
ncbi:MAG: pyridoxal phosphate-dependent aminotransferase [Deltaproteobacteria bacterium]|nr:pyridoxal phosphate-dependent aminotransferase [Deltaproteobacteria bacterium]